MTFPFSYETHMHTAQISGCASATAKEQVRAYKKRGYAGVIITDHFINGYSTCPPHLSWEDKMRYIYRGYLSAKKEGERIGLDVFYGWEFAIRGWDFLTYGLDLDFLLANPNIDRLTIHEYSALVRENGGYLAQAHPYRQESYIPNPYPVMPGLIDGVEVFNASMYGDENQKAFDFALKHKLAMQAGSDSHHERLSFASGIKLSQKARHIFDIINAIKQREVELIIN